MAANETNGDDRGIAGLAKAPGRGPSYPALTLEDAVGKAHKFWDAARRGAAPTGAVAKHWGYSDTSSSGKMAVSALLQFGLLEDQGSRDGRTVKLTARGLDIVLDQPDSERRLAALQEAARAPKMYADIMARWPPHELPLDSILRYHLMREKAFNASSVDGFIKDFRASIVFAKLDKPPKIESEAEPLGAAKPESETLETANTLPIATADQHLAAMPVGAQTTRLQERPMVPGQALHIGNMPATQQEREWLRGALSKDTGIGFRILVTGDLGPKAVGKLIKLLEAQKAVLEDDDEDEGP